MTTVATTFLVELKTGVNYDPTTYADAAGEMANLLTDTFSSTEILTNLLGSDHVAFPKLDVEVEICMEETLGGGRELVGRAALDITSEGRAKLDKPRLSKLLKANPLVAEHWPDMKIAKKEVKP